MELTTAYAFAMLDKAMIKANEISVAANIVILDTAGHLKAFIRMDNAFLGSIDIAQGKARTAMLFRMPSHEVGAFLRPEAETFGMLHTSGGLVGFKGGIPVVNRDVIIGYIGVSGGSPEQDYQIASAANQF